MNAAAPAFNVDQPDANVVTSYQYDGLGRLVTTTENGILSGTIQLRTDGTPRWSSAVARQTRSTYDALSRVATTTQNYTGGAAAADHDVTQAWSYDLAGNLLQQQDALGRVTAMEYDGANQPINTTVNFVPNGPRLADTNVMRRTFYDAVGRVSKQIDNYGVFGNSRGASHI